MQQNIKSIAIGSFDGIHIAHQKLIDKADALVIIEQNRGYLTAGYRRSFFTSKVCYFYHFETIKLLSPENFINKLLLDFPYLETIIVGYDFHFGKNKEGDAKLLERVYNKKVIIIDEVSFNNISVHSSSIKKYLKNGNIKMANSLLGREYSISGDIIKGQGIGSEKLFATINLDVKYYKLPLEGVYATQTKVDNKWFNSVSFLGHRVSTDGSFAVETHILDENIIVISDEVSIKFISFIRANKKFDKLEMLKKQIEDDIEEAKRLLQNYDKNKE